MPFEYDQVDVPKLKRIGTDSRITRRLHGTTRPAWDVDLEAVYPDHEWRIVMASKSQPHDGRRPWIQVYLDYLDALKVYFPDEDEIHPVGTLLDVSENHLFLTRISAHYRLCRLWKIGMITKYRQVGYKNRKADYSQFGTWYKLKDWREHFSIGTRPPNGIGKGIKALWQR